MSAHFPPSSPERTVEPGPATFDGRKRPLLVGRRRDGHVTIWFLERAALPAPGPWDVALVTHGT